MIEVNVIDLRGNGLNRVREQFDDINSNLNDVINNPDKYIILLERNITEELFNEKPERPSGSFGGYKSYMYNYCHIFHSWKQIEEFYKPINIIKCF